jgi:NAD(P)-dependent dehydrogenase (short-subunit alcohol dehydrogenase family)
MMNDFDLTGKTAVVTGGTGVLGGAMAKALAGAGANVAILGRDGKKAAEKVQQISEKNGEAISLIANVLDREALLAAREKVLNKWETIDIIVNAAGGNTPKAIVNPDQSIYDLSREALENIVNVNFLGSFYATRIFAKSMIEQKSGAIVNISSMAADRPMTRVMGYAASKAAIDNYTKWLATELAAKYGEGIRVNAIAPGFFIGEQNRNLLLNDDGSLSPRGQTIVDHTPMKRFGEPEDLAGTVVWLCSEASSFVTGTVIPVDGGFSAFSGV